MALLALGLAMDDAPAQERGTPAPVSQSGERSVALYTEEDLLFLSHMVVHHRQALEMSALVPSRTRRGELIRFARYLEGAQAAEIEHMQGLLHLAQRRGLQIPHAHMPGDPPMAGMLSSAEMQALGAASGAEFERLWLEGMILHHEGALTMAREQQRRQYESGRRPFGIDVLVEDIIEVQRAEIHQLRTWLEEWGLAGRR